VGYMGGSTIDPTYYNLGDHTETVQVDYDPTEISYEELLTVFFGSHDCSISGAPAQYKSVIFYHDQEQESLARQAKDDREASSGAEVQTDIEEAGVFYLAEDYHQKYALQGNQLFLRDFQVMYSDFSDVVDSTAAARVNGYLYGYGSKEKLLGEIDSFGLSKESKERLLALVY